MFQNAYKGISKLFTAELLGLIAAIISVIAAVIAIAVTGGEDTPEAIEAVSESNLVLLGALIVIAGIVGIIAFFISIFGYNDAKKDEPLFKAALFAVIIGIVASCAQNLFPNDSMPFDLLAILISLTKMLSTVYACQGIASIASQVGSPAVAASAKTVVNLTLILYCSVVVIDVITKFFSANTFIGNIAGALGVITSILTVVCYILYLGLLKKAKRMLEAA